MAGRESFSPGKRSNLSSIDSEHYPDEVVVDLDNKDPGAFEIVEQDDTPDEDRGRPSFVHNSTADLPDEEEDVSGSNAAKRIKRLKYETHAERRLREASERERDAAVEYARSRDAEIADLRQRLGNNNTALASSMTAERENRINDAKRRLAAAHADGDGEAIVSATADLGQAQAELLEIKRNVPRQQAEQERQPAPAQRQQTAAPQLAPNVAAWISHNSSWFGKDGFKDRTDVAMSIHNALTKRGVRPDSQEYTQELDRGLKAVYQDHKSFASARDDDGDEPRREARRTNVQAEGGRVDERRESSRKITLTSSELAIAKRLGVTPQDYAKQKVLRDRKAGAGA